MWIISKYLCRQRKRKELNHAQHAMFVCCCFSPCCCLTFFHARLSSNTRQRLRVAKEQKNHHDQTLYRNSLDQSIGTYLIGAMDWSGERRWKKVEEGFSEFRRTVEGKLRYCSWRHPTKTWPAPDQAKKDWFCFLYLTFFISHKTSFHNLNHSTTITTKITISQWSSIALSPSTWPPYC